ncbi:glycosyltransferase family A protein [Mongoliitalea daihaiensis]|uniref:glycosyltransferase family A protein n=1 Tax=Mongoliitalea daihaiensis TaxID=2782006 RepID=UPI001F43D158|nr:glycosyltransferase family A protein [Mongoliitalea daihaiensis]UJP63307.1 glycosyltransferase family 2 protein [Mongoliitalea daihaiensis]
MVTLIEDINDLPLVSIICTVYNQESMINQTLESVFGQTYPHLELLIIDNGSRDASLKIIENSLKRCPSHIPASVFIHPFTKNYCQSFNEVFLHAKGKYFIDLSGDDILMADHINIAVKRLLEKPEAWAVFSNVLLFERERKTFSHFYQTTTESHIEEGNLYMSIVGGNPVLSVSLVVDTEKFKKEGMYDEHLVYEDFDMMVRMSRKYPLFYTGVVGVEKTIHQHSFSATQYQARNSRMLPSTYQVCRKIQVLNQTAEEHQALIKRVSYELKMAVVSGNFSVAEDFIQLGKEIGLSHVQLCWSQFVCWLRLDMSFILPFKENLTFMRRKFTRQ